MSLLISLLTTLTMAQAADPAHCTYLVERNEGTQLQRIWSEASQSCFLSIHPLDGYYDMIYRDHLFTSEGSLMIFNSFGPGSESKATGAREYFMFPRVTNEFSYAWDNDNKLLIVTHVTGDQFVFDARKARLISMTRANVTVANDIVPTNRGGVEINNFQGVLMDGGWALGSSPTGNSRSTSQFRDGAGNTCDVKNTELFRYSSSGNNLFRYRDDASLQKFLKSKCPRIKFL